MTKYVLTINSNKEDYSKITDILKVTPSSIEFFWEFSIDENSSLYTRSISYFVDLLEVNKQKLRGIGIKDENISIWIYKPYEGQCNMEFSPQEMRRLSDNNITLCISCWETV